MTSDLAWQLPGSNPKQFLRLWYENERLTGFAWFQPPCQLQLQLDAATDPALAQDMLDWGIAVRKEWPKGALPYLDHQSMDEWADAIRNPRPVPESGRQLVVSVMATDTDLERIVSEAGFSLSTHHEPYLVHDLTAVTPEIPDGYAVKPVGQSPEALEAYVEAHRDAWAPSTGFTLAHLERVREFSEVFEPELNLVGIDASGEIAACTIFWQDTHAGIGSIEPFGTRPAHRGTGISKALILSGLTALKRRGMHGCQIHTAGFNHPAKALYRSCGFREVTRSRTWTTTL